MKQPTKSYRSYAYYANRAAFLAATASVPKADRCFYEIIREDRPANLHFDLEWEEDADETVEGNERAIEKVKTFVKRHIASALTKIGVDIQAQRVAILTSTRKEPAKLLKYSFHVVLPRLPFENNHTAMWRFVNGFICPNLIKDKEMWRSSDGRSTIVDITIWSRNRPMRLNASHKATDPTRTPFTVLSLDTISSIDDSFVVPEAKELKGLRIVTDTEVVDALNEHKVPVPKLPEQKRRTKGTRQIHVVDANDTVLRKVTELFRKSGDPVTTAVERTGTLVKCVHSAPRPCATAPNQRHANLRCYCVLRGNEVRMNCHGENCRNTKTHNPEGTLLGALSIGFDRTDAFEFYDFHEKYHQRTLTDELRDEVIEDAKRGKRNHLVHSACLYVIWLCSVCSDNSRRRHLCAKEF